MMRKRALIVDDSKSARVVLSRMLEKYGIEVDMAESAEQAIGYLEHNRPDAIFMDHLMPGMDGLQAVQAIKGNPQTAMIPIMMYTSQEGELYVGQARALGAMGVLPKQVRPVDVSKVLYELHLLPDRRDAEESSFAPVELDPSGTAKAPASAAAANTDPGKRIELAIRDQSAELRRFIVASLDSFAARVVGELRNLPARVVVEPAPAAAAAAAAAQKPPWAWIAATVAAALAALGFGLLWMGARNDGAGARAELATFSTQAKDLARSREVLDETVRRLTAALANSSARAAAAVAGGTAAAGAGGASGADGANPAGSTALSATRTALVPYGEVPLDRGRLDVMRDLLTQLVAEGFRGVVKVTSYAGLFCLGGDATTGYVPAKPNVPAVDCAAIGNPFEDSLSGQQRQSLAFGNLIAGVRERTGGAISVTIQDGASSHVAMPYPAQTATLTAAEWNKAAAANNRVEFAVQPAAAP
ncbi:MAG TPA: response regulator [Steroidobacteraceae bacterium]|nr:response regulator [Steroidobacteraceae bacterium]